MNKFPEHDNLNLSEINKTILERWRSDDTFSKNLTLRAGSPEFIFYEGPPSANGLPGIHHIISRTLKDIFCRYKTLKGFKVDRKAGWDTHGLPVELAVEQKLNITKDDIGKSISIEDYNKTCRKEVMKYTDIWEGITEKMGYWVDTKNPYITYDNKYIESVWWILKELYNKGLMYKGYTIQPYSPAAGTGLSSHELNMPGSYKDVKDTTGIAQFKAIRESKSEFLFENINTDVYFLAWTTTPWTLLSNTALAVGKKIKYSKIRTFNPYSKLPVTIIMATELIGTLFSSENSNLDISDFNPEDKKIPFKIIGEYTGEELVGINYEQLLPYQQPTDGDAFRVIPGDFVTTSDGTGIVHIAPSFGADDFAVAKQNGIGSLTLVDKRGYFVENTGEFSNRPVKNGYDKNIPDSENSVDVDIVVKLKKENKLFKTEKYEHSYPHCWRTHKPILYYPLDSWFIKTTAVRDRLIELNKTINWKPVSTGEGRFGKWLENLIDWNLTRSRYWGTPLPIWRAEDGNEEICIGSIEELNTEIKKSIQAGFMNENPLESFKAKDNTSENYQSFDLHRPYVDNIILVSPTGNKMTREPDLIDVWFDSGAMPYAQSHFPFESKEGNGPEEQILTGYPAEFIAEGVDQTRGWFFTLHAISVMLFDKVSFKNVISTGMVLDKFGGKMSKSKPETLIDPFKTIEEFGSDALRWYMISNAQPWDNLKFDIAGVDEVKRKFFGTLYNTYSFFSLYANIDNFTFEQDEIPVNERPEIDRWIISLLNTLVKEVNISLETYEPTKATRQIQDFVIDNLSNWYVRLNRKRFWGQEYDNNKKAAYQTLYTCLVTVAKLMSPISPFYSDMLYTDLCRTTNKETHESVHHSFFPEYNESLVNSALEQSMDLAQKISSMVLGLRRKCNIKVRQPLQKIMIPVISEEFQNNIEAVKSIISAEVNIKEIEFLKDNSGLFSKKLKANFKLLGKKYGKLMKFISSELETTTAETIFKFEATGKLTLNSSEGEIILTQEEVEILTEEIPGLLAVTTNNITVALDTQITEELKSEGIARELVNKIQNIRKDSGFEVSDKIILKIKKHDKINEAILKHKEYISSQVLAYDIILSDEIPENDNGIKFVELDIDLEIPVIVNKY